MCGIGCEVSDEIVGHALECGIAAADSVAGDLIIPDDSPALANMRIVEIMESGRESEVTQLVEE